MGETEIEREAENFLKKYHDVRTLPVPIEPIAETKLNLQLVPWPAPPDIGPQEDFRNGFLALDLTSIYIDANLWTPGYTNPRRSTVAHEIGHLILHRDVYEQCQFGDSIRDYLWFRCLKSNQAKIRVFDRQAAEFSGRILVPRKELRELFRQYVADDELTVPTVETAIQGLADDFQVSRDMVRYRLQEDRAVKNHQVSWR